MEEKVHKFNDFRIEYVKADQVHRFKDFKIEYVKAEEVHKFEDSKIRIVKLCYENKNSLCCVIFNLLCL